MSGRDPFEPYHTQLRDLFKKNRLRSLNPRTGIDFTSNDYLALAGCERIREAVIRAMTAGTQVGAGGSRLLRGNAPEHAALEAEACRFFGCESTLFFGSGYAANYAILSTLPQQGDLLVLDSLVHASAHEGACAGRAEIVRASHNDTQAFEDRILAWRARSGRGTPWIVVESLYSMDGDRAPLEDLMALADRHGGILCIDEAHATGVYGPCGRGLAAAFEGRRNVVTLHTCSKALGGAGALVNCARVLCDFLVNRCRPFIYATAPSPMMASAALESLYILQQEPHRRERLERLISFAYSAARARNIAIASTSQILPVVIGEDGPTMVLARALIARGFDVRGVRPPTVPEGTARLRVAITLNVGEREITGLFDALAEELADLAA